MDLDLEAAPATTLAPDPFPGLSEPGGAPPKRSRKARKPRRTPKPKRRTERGRSKTPGVVVIAPRGGRQFYSLRYREPATGRIREPQLDGVTTRPAADDAAGQLYRNLQRRSLQVTLAGGKDYAPSAATLLEEMESYLKATARNESPHGRPTSRTTLKAYDRAIGRFVEWCEVRDVTQLTDLTRTTLDKWRTSLLATPAHGRPRKLSTVNQSMKPVRQMLVAAALAGRLVHLPSDFIKGALQRLKQPAPKPRCFTVPEIQAVLRAALDYDVSESRPRTAPPMAPVVATALLGGLRRGELATLLVREVLFDAPTAYDPRVTTGYDLIRLPGHKTKTGVDRDVLLAPFSPLLGRLLRALCRGRLPNARVFRMGVVVMGDYAKRLRKPGRGCPEGFCMKALRSTCATYQLPLPGHVKAKADRLGHTLAVAEAHYMAKHSGMPLEAPSLDAVMQCEAELLEIIARVEGGQS